jgi:hypothetical protein
MAVLLLANEKQPLRLPQGASLVHPFTVLLFTVHPFTAHLFIIRAIPFRTTQNL